MATEVEKIVITDIKSVFQYTFTATAVTALTAGATSINYSKSVTVLNDDGVNTNSTMFIGYTATECLIPLRAGVDFTVDSSSTQNLYVQGTSGDIITVISWKR